MNEWGVGGWRFEVRGFEERRGEERVASKANRAESGHLEFIAFKGSHTYNTFK